MSIESVAENLFVETSVVSMGLLIFLLSNNIALYRVLFKDKLSVMLLSTIVMSVVDFIWHYVDGCPDWIRFNYFLGYVYAITFMLSLSMLCQFAMECFEIKIRSKKLHFLLFVLPLVMNVFFCVTTPWTGWLYTMDEEGLIQYMPAYNGYVEPVSYVYALGALLLGLYNLIGTRKSDPNKFFYGICITVFSLLVVGIFAIQQYVVGLDDNYIVTSLAWAIGLLFLTINVNTDRLLKSREKIVSVESDLAIAANIQSGALPSVERAPALLKHPEVKVSCSMKTAKEVGGDFYDFFEVDDTHVCFVIADVSGKGVPAALFMMIVKTMIKDHASMKSSTAEIFNDVNRLLCENNVEEMFATAWIGILDTETRVMKCTNAGHNAPCFARRDGYFKFLEQRHGLFLAGMEDTQYKEADIRFESGDCLFLYTDGLTEAHNGAAQIYGEKRLLNKLNSAKVRSGDSFLKQVADDVNDFCEGTEPFDDLTMMVITVV